MAELLILRTNRMETKRIRKFFIASTILSGAFIVVFLSLMHISSLFTLQTACTLNVCPVKLIAISTKPAMASTTLPQTSSPHEFAVNNCSQLLPDIIVIVFSSVHNKDRRQALRDTWLSDPWKQRFNYCHMFLFGRRPAGLTESVWQSLLNESQLYNDILISDSFDDTYAKLSYKTLEMLRVTDAIYSKSNYLLKVDDDTLVNMPKVMEAINESQTFVTQLAANGSGNGAFIAGSVSWKHRPLRNRNTPWYVPESVYNKTFYPPFARGPAYVVNKAAVRLLLQAWPPVPMLQLEDVNMGLLAEASGVRLIDPGGFRHLAVSNWCELAKLRSAHYMKPERMQSIWAQRRNSTVC